MTRIQLWRSHDRPFLVSFISFVFLVCARCCAFVRRVCRFAAGWAPVTLSHHVTRRLRVRRTHLQSLGGLSYVMSVKGDAGKEIPGDGGWNGSSCSGWTWLRPAQEHELSPSFLRIDEFALSNATNSSARSQHPEEGVITVLLGQCPFLGLVVLKLRRSQSKTRPAWCDHRERPQRRSCGCPACSGYSLWLRLVLRSWCWLAGWRSPAAGTL
ncbi:hypothetical protein BV25DRAFT_269423 [Artomyces pyxidatus]|uniref:Uncharacterized protein n=1 Tax=Artomyces pyxidatus TaxID=48021 RepID=A0ACB8T7T9_9AGAM|nr:hypothetical protein BV25DRAFT_269423 [Artomyces pyxidatus]